MICKNLIEENNLECIEQSKKQDEIKIYQKNKHIIIFRIMIELLSIFIMIQKKTNSS